MSPFILGIAGGTGSGKTTIAEKLHAHFAHRSVYIPHDRYYKDQSSKTMDERVKTNYDHPEALETSLFISHLKDLLKGKDIQVPEYDFTQHTRKPLFTTHVSPAPLIIIEGILIFQELKLRDLVDFKVYVDVPSDIRILRRTMRDVQERGRTFESCIEQYLAFTRPMHEIYVEPSKEFADIIIPRGGFNENGITALMQTIEKRIGQ